MAVETTRGRRMVAEQGTWCGDGRGTTLVVVASATTSMAAAGSGQEEGERAGRGVTGLEISSGGGLQGRQRGRHAKRREPLAGSRGGDRGHASASRAGGSGAQNERERERVEGGGGAGVRREGEGSGLLPGA